jgi:hypothetical protein
MIMTTISLLLLLLLFSPILYSTIQQQLVAGSSSHNNDSRAGPAVIVGTGAAGAEPKNITSNINTNINKNSTFLAYDNPDFGIKLLYPSNWTKQEDNLRHQTIVGFSLIHEDIYDFANTTLAEVDLRIYNAPQNETSAKFDIGQINTAGEVIVTHYKNSSTTLGGLPALRIINYYYGDVTQKEMQVWTFVPNKNVILEMLYIAQPSKYSLYLPIAEKMIGSVVISH